MFHLLGVQIRQLYVGLEVMVPQESYQGLVLEQNVLLVDLEVRLGFPQIVHLGYQEVTGTGTHFELKFLHFWLDLLEYFGVLELCVADLL